MHAMAEKDLSSGHRATDNGRDESQIAALVSQAASGDRSAFDALYHHHVNRVYGLCLRLAGDQHVAETLTQDAFVRAWYALDSFRGAGSFGGWLSRIATNLWRDRFRTYLRQERLLQKLADEGLAHTAAGSSATIQTVSESNDFEAGWLPARDPGWDLLTALELERAMTDLPPGARTVFVLHDIEGYKHGEIAELLGVTTGTTKAQLHRARRLLRELLSGDKEAANGA